MRFMSYILMYIDEYDLNEAAGNGREDRYFDINNCPFNQIIV